MSTHDELKPEPCYCCGGTWGNGRTCGACNHDPDAYWALCAAADGAVFGGDYSQEVSVHLLQQALAEHGYGIVKTEAPHVCAP